MIKIHTTKAPAAIGPYSQAILTDNKNMLFTSGQLGLNPITKKMPSDINSQVKQSLENLKSIVNEAGFKLTNIIKTTIFLKNMSDFPQVNQIYADFFNGHCPARSTIEVARLPLDGLVEIEAIAIK